MLFRPSCAILACLVLAAPAAALEKPYRVSLTGDATEAGQWLTGVRIELDDGWKTYWRMPGESGIPPEFNWKPSRPAQVEVLYPLPQRYHDASGETVGYAHEVVFPVRVDAGKTSGLRLDLELFFAVCKNVCIPATADAAIELGPDENDPLGSARVAEALRAVPAKGEAITAATAMMENGKPVLKLAIAARLDDIFVEAPSGTYLRAPGFSADGNTATLAIDNIDDLSKLEGAELKFTYLQGGKALEQRLVLP